MGSGFPNIFSNTKQTQNETYLSKCAFNLAEKIVIRDLGRVIVKVVNLKTKTLNFFEEIIQLKCFRELGIQSVVNPLRSAKLTKMKGISNNASAKFVAI